MASKDLQLELPLARRAEKVQIDMAVIARQPNKTAAINLCIQLSGLEDKEIYMALGIDAGQFSRIKKGDAYLPDNKESAFMRICGNDAPLAWAAQREGYRLVPLMSEIEAQNAELRAQIAERDQKLKTITEFFHNRVPSE